jgi:hypothetical protein
MAAWSWIVVGILVDLPHARSPRKQLKKWKLDGVNDHVK